MHTLSAERPWASAPNALQFKWVMTDAGLRMQWTLDTTAEMRPQLRAIEQERHQAAA